jgi:hypothetical protein
MNIEFRSLSTNSFIACLSILRVVIVRAARTERVQKHGRLFTFY